MGLFKKLLKIIAIILVIIAIIYFLLAVIAYASSGIVAGEIGILALGITGSIGWGTFALIGFGLVALASIISPEGTKLALDRVGDGISTVAENVVDIAGNAVSSVVDNVLKNPYFLVGGALLLWYFTSGSDEKEVISRDASYEERSRMYA